MPDFDLRSSASFISSNDGRHSRFAQTFMNEAEQFVLFTRQHGWILDCSHRVLERFRKQSRNKLAVPAVFRKSMAKLAERLASQAA